MANLKFVLIQLVLVSTSSNIFASERIIPQKVINLYRKYDCKPIDKSWWSEKGHPGGVEAPYAFDFIPGHKGKSMIFLCDKGKNNYHLIFHDEVKNDELSKCPQLIDQVSFGRGITISSADEVKKLEGFFRSSGKRSLPMENIKKKNPSILFEYDGVGNEIYCHQGKWWFRFLH